jgi:hypothetical protein
LNFVLYLEEKENNQQVDGGHYEAEAEKTSQESLKSKIYIYLSIFKFDTGLNYSNLPIKDVS